MTIDRRLQGWCLQGPLRASIVKAMTWPMTLTQLRKRLIDKYKSVSLSNISDVIRSMIKEGYCICHNPDMQRGRLYELSEEMKKIQEELLRD